MSYKGRRQYKTILQLEVAAMVSFRNDALVSASCQSTSKMTKSSRHPDYVQPSKERSSLVGIVLGCVCVCVCVCVYVCSRAVQYVLCYGSCSELNSKQLMKVRGSLVEEHRASLKEWSILYWMNSLGDVFTIGILVTTDDYAQPQYFPYPYNTSLNIWLCYLADISLIAGEMMTMMCMCM